MEAAKFWWLVPFAVPALAAVLAAFIAAAAWVARYAHRGWPRVLALAGAWTLADLARQFVATGFPWNPLGSVWEFPGHLGDVFIQPAALVSVHGLTLATVLLACLPMLGWRWRGRRCRAGRLAGLRPGAHARAAAACSRGEGGAGAGQRGGRPEMGPRS